MELSFHLKCLVLSQSGVNRGPLRGLGGWLLGVAGLQNPVGGVKDALGGPFANLLALRPRLNVASAEFSAGQSERFAAKQGHGLGFYLRHATRRLLCVGEVCFLAMQEAVGQFMDEG